jgi:hypothetical protein
MGVRFSFSRFWVPYMGLFGRIWLGVNYDDIILETKGGKF